MARRGGGIKRKIGVVSAVVAVLLALLAPTAAATTTLPLTRLPGVASGSQTVQMRAISCPTVTWCAAVGGASNGDPLPGGTSSAAQRPVAWLESGGHWTAKALPLPAASAGVPYADLTAISCPAPGRCVAVGTVQTAASTDNERVLVETLRDGSWHPTSLPAVPGTFPFGVGYPYLGGISCPSTRWCLAVGAGPLTSVFNKSESIAYRYASGHWTGQAVAGPTGTLQSALSRVSCPAAGHCVAVGAVWTNKGKHGLVATLAGRTWHAAGVGPAGTGLTGVSCRTTASCTAVGNTSRRALALSLAGGQWSTHLFPSQTRLGDLSCQHGTCVAVGDVATRPARSLVETGAGDRWTSAQPLPGVSGLTAVSCPTAHQCLAAQRSATTAGLAALAGGRWTPLLLQPPRAQPIAALASVACPRAGSCVAVGAYEHAGGTGDLIETETGSRWRPTTLTATKQGQGLFGVSCAPGSNVASGCTAVGGDRVATDTSGQWTAAAVPTPGLTEVELNAVSCFRPRVCTAVGSAYRKGATELLVARRSGRRWTARLVAEPSGNIAGFLFGVSCPTRTFCVAVGAAASGPGGGATGGLALQLHDGRPSGETYLGPNGTNGVYDSVSCATPTRCVAGGTTNFKATVARFTGGRWRAATIPGSTDSEATAVSCPTALLCRAALSSDDSGRTLHLATIRPGSATITGAFSAPPAAAVAGLSGISCPQSRSCTVVGGGEGRPGAFGLIGTT